MDPIDRQNVTEHDKMRCAERELALRRRVYPGRVRAGTMTEKMAEHEIKCMEAIVEDYRKICLGERLI